jgi:hypothetical protein
MTEDEKGRQNRDEKSKDSPYLFPALFRFILACAIRSSSSARLSCAAARREESWCLRLAPPEICLPSCVEGAGWRISHGYGRGWEAETRAKTGGIEGGTRRDRRKRMKDGEKG